MTLSVLFIKFTVALAAAVILFACGTPGEPTRSNDGVSDEVFRVVSKVRKSMGTVHSYRVDGTITTYRSGGAEDTRITVRGDWVGPDRLDWDVSGLRHNRAEHLIIVGDRAYQRERNTSTRDWSEWVAFNANSVDTAYTARLPELTLGLDEYLARIPWSSAASAPERDMWLRGIHSEDGEQIFTYYRMRVRKAGPLPFVTLRHWIHELDTLVVDHSGPERVVVQEASYEFSLFTPTGSRSNRQYHDHNLAPKSLS